jgi:5'-nucleotidase
MNILISNDDGYRAPGIAALERAVSREHATTVIAPEVDRSGTSSALTLHRGLRVSRADNGYYYVDGMPVDCVHVGITALLDVEPDMVIAGINAGSNMGDDVVYSGTVGAAVEGRFLGAPSIAVSLAGEQRQHYDTAAEVVVDLLQQLRKSQLPENMILNVNVPDIPYEQVHGIKVTRLGTRHKADTARIETLENGENVFWIGAAGAAQDFTVGTDFGCVADGYVSITPLTIDLTHRGHMELLNSWVAPVNAEKYGI